MTLTDVNAFVDPYDCSVDKNSCMDSGPWEVNGSILVYDQVYQDADWASQSSQSGVTGVMGYRHNRRRILPRTTADLVSP